MSETDAKASAALDEGAKALAPRVERVAPGIYAVPSRSTPGELHVVVDRQVAKVSGAATLGRWACCCKAFGFGNACCHVEAVIWRRLEERRVQKARRGRRSQPSPQA